MFPAIRELLDILISIFTLVAGVVAGLWAYTRFIVERGLLPPVQFDIDCCPRGKSGDRRVVEFLVHLKNVGSATLVARNIRLDIRYHRAGSGVTELFRDEKRLGRLRFPDSLVHDLDVKQEERPAQAHPSKKSPKKPHRNRGLPVMSYDTFVQPGVDQIYTFVTVVPDDVDYVLAWSCFEYAQGASSLQSWILSLSRKLGLIQYSLEHVKEPHTVERMFQVGEDPGGQANGEQREPSMKD